MLAALVDVAENVGYPLLFALIAIETMGVPLPGETALITAGIVAARGNLSIEVVIALAAAAAILGDNVGFAIGRRYGRRLLEWEGGPFPHHRRRLIEVGEPFFDRHGPKAVFLGRWVSGLRITAAWLAGAHRMSWPTFTFWNALGGICWALSIGLAAYFGGHAAERIVTTAGIAGLVGVVFVGVALYIVTKVRRRRAEELADAELEAEETT
jgi:membrane protein DedA with SNARE-associated domain